MAEYNKINLNDLFQGLQSQMAAKLNTNRSFISHPGSKGDALENAWIEWLREYLPNRYSVEKAIIIDSEGNISDQIDIVIYDNWYTPFVFNQNGFKYIPAEGVYAVFEVKPNLTKEYIKYAGDKIESVRKLFRTSTSMINSGQSCKPRRLTMIVGGLLCTTSDIKQNKTIEEHLKDLKDFRSLDFICAVENGAYTIEYKFPRTEAEWNYKSYYQEREFITMTCSKPENSLITFFLQLSHTLQQCIGTIPAIDFQKYMESIGK